MGRWCLVGTRIPLYFIADTLDQGGLELLHKKYPHVKQIKSKTIVV